jgi:hypothetical protein
VIGSGKTNSVRPPLRHQEKTKFPRFSEPPLGFVLYYFVLYYRWRGSAPCLWQFALISRSAHRPSRKAARGVGDLTREWLGTVARDSGEWRAVSGQ